MHEPSLSLKGSGPEKDNNDAATVDNMPQEQNHAEEEEINFKIPSFRFLPLSID